MWDDPKLYNVASRGGDFEAHKACVEQLVQRVDTRQLEAWKEEALAQLAAQ